MASEPGAGRALASSTALAALAYTALTVLFSNVGVIEARTALAPGLGDCLFNLYLLKWGAAQWLAGLPDFATAYWNAPFFYPQPGTILLSDHMLGPAAATALLSLAGIGPILAYNLLFLGSFALCGATTYWVCRRAGLSSVAAFAAGLVFTFSPFRTDQRPHLQMLLAQWVPLVLWFWDRLLARRSWRAAVPFLVFYALHATSGNYLAYMIHLPMAAIFAVRAAELKRELVTRRSLVLLGLVGLACLSMLAVVYGPYVTADLGFRTQRFAGEWHHWGASLTSFLTPSPANWTFGDWGWKIFRPENTLAAGLVPTLLAGLGLWWLAGRRRRRDHALLDARRLAIVAGLVALAAAAFVLAEIQTHHEPGSMDLLGYELRVDSYKRAFLVWLAASTAGLVLYRRWSGRWPLAGFGTTSWERGLLAGGLASLLLAFPLLFMPLTQVLPGLGRMRVPARFYVFVSLAIAWLVARGIDALRARFPDYRGFALGCVLAAAITLELAPRPMEWVPIDDEHSLEGVYRFLRTAPDVQAVLELPVGDTALDLAAMYGQSFHGKPLLNGYSGYFPSAYEELRQRCASPVPDEEALAYLRRRGVSHVLIRPQPRWSQRRLAELAELSTRPGITRIYAGGNARHRAYLYRLD